MKEFNLEKALAGEPVVLNNGNKAHIVGKIKDEYDCKYCLVGYEVTESEGIRPETWSIEGSAGISNTFKAVSIAGMWEEPKCFINGVGVPYPVTEETWVNGGHYWYPTLDHNDYVRSDRFYTDVPVHTKLIRQGLVFETEEGARAMAKALLNYTVEQRDE